VIFEGLFEALATQLKPLDFSAIRCPLLDGGERRGLGLVRRFAGSNFGDHGGIPARTIGIRTAISLTIIRDQLGDAVDNHPVENEKASQRSNSLSASYGD
jgi:hypothetical protein